uniref:Ephrin RBD domain-containing protein n=1 Tax=Parascaris univalens TaxID=6257 RepID=A0A915ABR5_PARUN
MEILNGAFIRFMNVLASSFLLGFIDEVSSCCREGIHCEDPCSRCCSVTSWFFEGMFSSTASKLFSLALFCSLCLHRLAVHCATVDLNWVSYNPLFSEMGLHILRKEVRINDRIRFSCSQNGSEYVAIHRVSDREAFACERFSTFTDSLVGTCTKANDSVVIGLRELPMLPNELSYKPNHDYYFITTSTGTADGLENSKGGLCASRRMRLQVRVTPRTSVAADDAHMTSDDSFSSRDRVMVLPVDSRQYPIPVMYVPVSNTNGNSQNEGERRIRLPYQLYVPKQLAESVFANSHVIDERGSRFDAHDEPLRPFEAPGVRAFPTDHGHDQPAQSNALRNDGQSDFEVEYVDIPNRGSQLAFINSLLSAAVFFMVATHVFR